LKLIIDTKKNVHFYNLHGIISWLYILLSRCIRNILILSSLWNANVMCTYYYLYVTQPLTSVINKQWFTSNCPQHVIYSCVLIHTLHIRERLQQYVLFPFIIKMNECHTYTLIQFIVGISCNTYNVMFSKFILHHKESCYILHFILWTCL